MSRRTLAYLLTATLLSLILVRIFLVDSFIVRGDSMTPTLHEGEYVLVWKPAYARMTPARGDVVVGAFRPYETTKVVKRVVGLPREEVIISDGALRVYGDEGSLRFESPLHDHIQTSFEYRLDPYEYFLLGDNAAHSFDSRELGPVDSYMIDGKLFLKIQWHPFRIERL